MTIPRFPGELRKNDGLFLYGACQSRPFVLVYEQNSVEIVHGPSCKVELELKLNNCSLDNVPVYQRRGGGGTVVLSPGMVVIVIVGDRKGSESALSIFSRIHDAIISICNEAGISNVEKKGISDLTINNRKILGSSLYMGTDPVCFYYQSCLMVSSQTYLMNRYLEHPPREPDYRTGREHSDFCTTINDQGFSISVKDVCMIINRGLKEKLATLYP